MDKGNWIPISKAFIKDLPKGRAYTRLEAAFSLQAYYDCKNDVTVSGYSALWSWSRNKVTKFLEDMNVVIIYPENTKKRRNQKGHIAIHKQDIKGTYKGHIRCIENTYLQKQEDIKRTKEGHKKDISRLTTIEPKNLNPNPKEKKIHPFEIHLLKLIINENLSQYELKIIEFYKYRMSMKKKQQYQTEKGVNGLIRNVLALKKAGLNVNDALEQAMEKNWQSPELHYFVNTNTQKPSPEYVDF